MHLHLLADSPTELADACAGESCSGRAGWSELHAVTWVGMLQTFRQLTRDLDAELEASHGLSLTGLEVLARLAAADGHRLRLSALADQIGLSVSGISRLVDTLEHPSAGRGPARPTVSPDCGATRESLVERQTCPEDGRAVNVVLTATGLERLRATQATQIEAAQRRFFGQVSPDELRTLAAIFARPAERHDSVSEPRDRSR